MKEFAVSFKGGMARGLGSIGLMRFLQEENLKPKYFAGSSSGALVAAGFAMNYTWDKILNDFKEVKITKLMSLTNLVTKGGLIPKERFLEMLSESLETPIQRIDIKNLPNKLYVFSSNLKTQNRVVIHSGNLGEALIRSCSYPLVIERSNFANYIDGDLTSSYSANYLRNRGAEVVIGCGYRPRRSDLFTTNPLDTLISTYRLLTGQIDSYYNSIDPVDYELEFKADDVSYMGFKDIDRVVERAYRKAKNHQKEIFKILEL